MSSLGIFSAAADWGLEPEFGPKLGEEKIPGKVKVRREGDEIVYDVFGNGDDIWGENDEGFFVFTEKTGSWTLTAKVLWEESGGRHEWAKIGLMVREYARKMKSKNYFVLVRAGQQDSLGDAIQAQWRDREGDLSFSTTSISGSPRVLIPNPGSGVFLRLTRNAVQNIISSEWSYDGVKWVFLHSLQIDMANKVSYGISITNHFDNTQLARATITGVSLSPALPAAKRYVSSERIDNNEYMDVLLNVYNPHETIADATIEEIIPDSWHVSSISHDGKRGEEDIVWRIPLKPGSTVLTYNARLFSSEYKVEKFSGNINSRPIFGVQDLVLSNLERIDFEKTEFYQTVFFTTVPLVMMILHLSLFLFHRKAKENLYFAMMLACLACFEFFWNKKDFITDIYILRTLDFVFMFLLIGILSLLESIFKFLIYEEKPRRNNRNSRKYWIAAMIFIPFFLSGILGYFSSMRNIVSVNGMIVLFSVFFSLIWGRILITGIVRRLEGIWIIGIGTIVLLSIIFWLGLAAFSIVPPLPDPKLVDVSFLLFIITLSIYLAYKYAKTSKNLELLNIDLEKRVASRTADLVQANDELRELDKMKTQFVSQASHDLRTPLTAIKGSLDNLLMGIAGELNEKQQKVMTRATKSVDRLTNLINDVLDLNRIETGRIVLEKTDIPFKALVENIINENRPAAEQKQIQLVFDAEKGDYTLYIDGSKIERVVGELVSNAIKYTPDNGSVNVSMKQSVGLTSFDPPYNLSESPLPPGEGQGEGAFSKESNFITLTVQDSGIGMTQEECGKIWDRFYRTSASKKFAKGSGLGLSIAKELVELHGGTLLVESEQGKGTVFQLALPVRES